MRIAVVGDCDSARALRGDLSHAGFVVGTSGRFTVYVEEGKPGEILVDSIQGKIDQAIVLHLRELATQPIRVLTVGGIQSEFEIRIHVPPDDPVEQVLIEKAILRGLLSLGDPKQPEPEPQVEAAKRAPWRDWLPGRRLYDRTAENN